MEASLRQPPTDETAHSGNAFAQGNRQLVSFTASYKTCDIQLRETLARALRAKGNWSDGAVAVSTEHAMLSTCNRLELYLVTRTPEAAYEALAREVSEWTGVKDAGAAFMVKSGAEAAHHLFRVAAGLESVVVGEPQILTQVKAAGVAARKTGNSRGVLSPLFDRAVTVGERIRSTYGLGDEEQSLSDIAVAEVLRTLPIGGTAMLIGTGKMVQLAARRLRGHVGRLYVATRRSVVPKGLEGAKLVRYAQIPRYASDCDAIISATSTNRPLLLGRDLRGRKKVVVDLGMPRNVSASARGATNVHLIDLDDISTLARHTKASRRHVAAENSTATEASEFYAWLVRTRLTPTLSEIYAWANEVREEELRRAKRKLGPRPDRELRVLDAMGRRIVSKLLARPAKFAHGRRDSLTEDEKLDLLGAVFGVDID